MINNILDYSKCSNCTACVNICPKDAISVVKNRTFYELSVNSELCVNCGKCKDICPVNNPHDVQKIYSAFGGYSRDPEIVKNSSSGGAFSTLADYILRCGGIVYGAAYENNFREVCITSTKAVSIDDLRRSKYVESYVGYSFREIKKELEQGKQILFCGAPCQVAGLKRYLNKEYTNLLTCDFSCGGMPSHKFYDKYINKIEEKLQSPVTNVNFRPKIFGWRQYAIEITGQNGKKYKNFDLSDPYFYSFLYNRNSMREYCYSCDFSDNHYSDIILADFWLSGTVSHIPDNNTGISLILTNSEKGEKFITTALKNFSLTILDTDAASYNLVKKIATKERMDKRQKFISVFENEGYDKAVHNIKIANKYMLVIKYYLKKLIGRICINESKK